MSDPNQPREDDPFAPPPAGGSTGSTGSVPGIPGDAPPPSSTTPSYGTTPPPPPAYGVPQSYGVPVVAPQNGSGTAALVLGILSITCCGFFTGIIAIVLGRKGMALADQGLATNRSMAQIGMILGIVGTVLSILGLVFALATGTWSSSVTTNGY